MNKLTSVHTQLPYEYYSLPYCRPDKIESSAENLGEVLRGDRIETSPYEVMPAFPELQCPTPGDPLHPLDRHSSLLQIAIRIDEQCKVLCRIQALTAAQANAFTKKIEDEYRVNMCADPLPICCGLIFAAADPAVTPRIAKHTAIGSRS